MVRTPRLGKGADSGAPAGDGAAVAGLLMKYTQEFGAKI
jgi:hypothetical protein